jgi:uncharacterized heparinase superfamily protein
VSLRNLGRYFRTVRYLRPTQVTARLCLKLRRPRSDLRPAPAIRPMIRAYEIPVEPAATLLGPGVFRFLNVERRCVTASDWRPKDVSMLWVYNLHYFDDLNARDAAQRGLWHRSLLDRWIADNPPGTGEAWEPYPVSRRIVNWIKWAVRGNTLPPSCRESIAVQTRWLTKRLEYHLLGNHLLANAKALFYAGSFFDGPEAERWCAHARRIIGEQLREQVLPDGGHFELSTMYHATVLEDLLDLVNVSQAYGRPPPADWLAAIARMRRWLSVMSHPDGEIAFFNDATFGVAPQREELDEYAARLGLAAELDGKEAITVLAQSGYVRAIAGGAYLLCDCAAVGPDYLPGHAHADTLSFELSLFGQRVFVNSGISRYGEDVERERQRGTAAHNTVIVDGCDSTEVWSGFRVARRARARLRSFDAQPRSTSIHATHDGYSRLPGRNEHSRRWMLGHEFLRIEDTVSGRFARAEALFHMHPEIVARASRRHGIDVCGPAGLLASVDFDGALSVEIRNGTWHPGFGLTLPNQHAAVQFAGDLLVTKVAWARSCQ